MEIVKSEKYSNVRKRSQKTYILKVGQEEKIDLKACSIGELEFFLVNVKFYFSLSFAEISLAFLEY